MFFHLIKFNSNYSGQVGPMKRKKEIIVIAHCLINVNAKVHGIAQYEGASSVIADLISHGYGLIQLPCIEQAMLGINRWGIVNSQCNFPAFKRRCNELLEPVVDQIEDFINNGYQVKAIIGLDGSPTCGVNKRAYGNWYGEVAYEFGLDEKVKSVGLEDGMGSMMEVLKAMLDERGLDIRFCAISEADDMTTAEALGLI